MFVRLATALSLLLFALGRPAPAASQTADPAQPPGVGPAHGWLLLEGGGRLRGTDIVTRFVALAGGPDRRYVVIPTAISDTESTPARRTRCESGAAEILGVAHVTCLDARDRDEANGDAFVQALRAADAIWIYGGDEGRLVDRYVGTRAADALRDVLAKGGVIGGTSAGAMILADFIPSRATSSGFRFLPGTAIAPHYTQRHYEATLARTVAEGHARVGLGIDESTAVIVHGGELEVIGEGTVTVLAPGPTALHPGQRFDLHTDHVTGS